MRVSKRSKLLILVILSLILFFVMNLFSRRITDDFYWDKISGTSIPVQSIPDIFASIYNYYTAANSGMSGGRVPSVFFTQLFLLLGKFYFNFANAAVYTLLVLLMYFHIMGNLNIIDKKQGGGNISLSLYGAIHISLWYLVPAWGENFLWLTGSCFHVWPVVIILFFLIPFRKKSDNHDYQMSGVGTFLLFPVGILAGWSYENVTAGVLLLLLAYFIWKGVKREKIALFETTGCLGFLVGFVLCLAAPGNFSRLNGYDIVRQWSLFRRIMFGLINTTNIFCKYGLFLAGLAAIACFELVYHEKKPFARFPFLYLLAALGSAYSMVFSPIFIERTFFPVSIFLIITVLGFLRQITLPEVCRRNAAAFITLVLICFSFSLTKAGIAIMKVYQGGQEVNIYERHYVQMH